MESRSRLIAPERMATWLVVTLGVALLALIAAVYGIQEARTSAAVNQLQFQDLDKRVKAVEASKSAAAAPAMPAEPAMPEEAAMPAEPAK